MLKDRQEKQLVSKTRERRHKRFAVDDMKVGAKTLVTTRAKLLDISMGGACVTSPKSLKPGGKQLVKIEGDKIQLTLMSTVIWEKLSESERNSRGEVVPVYVAGVAFIDVPPDKLLKLKDFMRMSGIPDDRKIEDHFSSSYLRFRMRDNDDAVVYHTNTLLVKTLSLGGMLAEMSEGIEVEKRFPMALVLPHDDVPIRFTARIVSSREIPDDKAGRCDVGVEFLEMNDDDRKRLDRFIHSLSEKNA